MWGGRWARQLPGRVQTCLGGKHGQEVSGRVPSPSLVTSPWFPASIQRNKHLPAAVLPAKRGVRVVAVFLNAFFELAAWAVRHLQSDRGRRLRMLTERSASQRWLIFRLRHQRPASKKSFKGQGLLLYWEIFQVFADVAGGVFSYCRYSWLCQLLN